IGDTEGDLEPLGDLLRDRDVMVEGRRRRELRTIAAAQCRIDAQVAVAVQKVRDIRRAANDVHAIEEREAAVGLPRSAEIADPLRGPGVASCRARARVRWQGERILGWPGNPRREREPTKLAKIVTQIEFDIDAAVTLARDVDELVIDFGNRQRIGRLAAREQ